MWSTSLIAGKLCTWSIRAFCSRAYFVSCLSNMMWQQKVTCWKWVILHTLQLTLRLCNLTLRSTACYITVHTFISNQVSYMETKLSQTPQLYLQQAEPRTPMRKYLPTCIIIPQWPLLFLPGSAPAMLCGRNVRYGAQTTQHEFGCHSARWAAPVLLNKRNDISHLISSKINPKVLILCRSCDMRRRLCFVEIKVWQIYIGQKTGMPQQYKKYVVV